MTEFHAQLARITPAIDAQLAATRTGGESAKTVMVRE
jgi:hypothetical protein